MCGHWAMSVGLYAPDGGLGVLLRALAQWPHVAGLERASCVGRRPRIVCPSWEPGREVTYACADVEMAWRKASDEHYCSGMGSNGDGVAPDAQLK